MVAFDTLKQSVPNALFKTGSREKILLTQPQPNRISVSSLLKTLCEQDQASCTPPPPSPRLSEPQTIFIASDVASMIKVLSILVF